jgi:hypothetical protein
MDTWSSCRAGQRDGLLKLRFDGPDDELQRMSTISSESLEEAERVRVAHTRAHRRLAASERQAEAVVGGAFALAALALVLCVDAETASPVLAASCVAALAIASPCQLRCGRRLHGSDADRVRADAAFVAAVFSCRR